MGGIRNFQVCARCRNHEIRIILKGHKKNCPFKFCSCVKCLVTKDRQSFIAKEIAMHRYEIKNSSDSNNNRVKHGIKLNLVRSKSVDEKSLRSQFPITKASKKISKHPKSNGEVRKDQLCSRCRNHGVNQLLRGHKNACPFANCICDKCEITLKRREIMAKQIKDYRMLKVPDGSTSSSETFESTVKFASPEIVPDEDNINSEHQFVEYEPIENRDIFFMVQSLFEKYATRNTEKNVQLVYAFAHLAKGNWPTIEKALMKGEKQTKSLKVRFISDIII